MYTVYRKEWKQHWPTLCKSDLLFINFTNSFTCALCRIETSVCCLFFF